jgi:hypothetical protein
MASQSSSTAVDLQKLLSGAGKMELKLVSAGIEAMRVCANQASIFAHVASEALQAMQNDKTSLTDTAHKFTAFGRQNAHAFTELARKLSTSYFDEVERLADALLRPASATADAAAPDPAPAVASSAPAGPSPAVSHPGPVKKPGRRVRKG